MRFIKDFSKITAPFTLLLKTKGLSAPARPVNTRINKNKLGTEGGGDIDGNKIDNTNVNLSSSIKKMSFRAGFLKLVWLLFNEKGVYQSSDPILFWSGALYPNWNQYFKLLVGCYQKGLSKSGDPTN